MPHSKDWALAWSKSSKALLHLPGEAASLMPEMADYKSHCFPQQLQSIGVSKLKPKKLKKHLRSFTTPPPS